MRSGTLEAHDEFEGVGAHEANPRFDFIEGEHDADVQIDSDNEVVVPELPKLAAARAELLAAPPSVRLDGIDVSHYQEKIDWGRVKAHPTWWGATKLTQSTSYADPTGPARRVGMAAAGLRARGLYHWLSPVTDPEKQAAWFIAHAGNLALGEFVMLDSEEAGITVEMVLAFLEAIEAWSRRVAVDYSGAFVAGGTIWQSTAVREGKFGPRPTVLAAYTTEAKALALPGVSSYPWSAWQFSSSGPVDGVWDQDGKLDRVDMNRVDDPSAFERACGYTAPPIIVDPPVDVVVDPPAPPAPPAPVTLTAALLGGDTDMGFIAANLDVKGQSSEPAWARFYVSGTVKRHVADGNEVERLKRHGLIPATFDLSNPDDPSLEWLTTAELNSYPTV